MYEGHLLSVKELGIVGICEDEFSKFIDSPRLGSKDILSQVETEHFTEPCTDG